MTCCLILKLSLLVPCPHNHQIMVSSSLTHFIRSNTDLFSLDEMGQLSSRLRHGNMSKHSQTGSEFIIRIIKRKQSCNWTTEYTQISKREREAMESSGALILSSNQRTFPPHWIQEDGQKLQPFLLLFILILLFLLKASGSVCETTHAVSDLSVTREMEESVRQDSAQDPDWSRERSGSRLVQRALRTQTGPESAQDPDWFMEFLGSTVVHRVLRTPTALVNDRGMKLLQQSRIFYPYVYVLSDSVQI
ncbi:hypothetical protein INR49_025050 [Caranx melampygus]|nr:hypothetical protein INR49_025050 [Caranx melampygus]